MISNIEKILEENKAFDIQHFQYESGLADHIIICSGHSNLHVRVLAERLTQMLRGKAEVVVSGVGEGNWAIVDLGAVMVHILVPEYREFYLLEDLYTPLSQSEIESEA